MTGRPDTPEGGFVPLPADPFGSPTIEPKARPVQPGPDAPTSNGATPPEPGSDAPAPPTDHAGRAIVCPYCATPLTNHERCTTCKGMLDPLSRQASQNAMGPWAVLDAARAVMPGCSFETLRMMIQRGRLTAASVVRGPTTRQFWMRADHAPGVSVYLGVCHACKAPVRAEQRSCAACAADLHVAQLDRQHLGLSPVSDLPGAVTQAAPAPSPASEPLAVSEEMRHLRRQTKWLGVTVFAMGVMLIVLGGALVWQQLEQKGVKLNLPGASTSNAPGTTPGGTSGTTTPSNPMPGPGPTPAATTGSTPPATDTPLQTPETGAAPVVIPETAPIHPALVGLDPALAEWHPDLRRAHELEKQGTLESVERAVQLVSRVLDEATRDDRGATASDRFPMLRSWLRRLSERADRLFAEQTLSG